MRSSLYFMVQRLNNTFLYSVFASGSARWTVLRSIDAAATWSIFLNCHGDPEGYRNGRRSKPVDTAWAIFTTVKKVSLTIIVRAVLLLRSLDAKRPTLDDLTQSSTEDVQLIVRQTHISLQPSLTRSWRSRSTTHLVYLDISLSNGLQFSWHQGILESLSDRE